MIVSSSTISTFSTSLIVLLSMITAYVAALSIWNLLLSPLKHIPGPWYAAISDFWLMTHIARFRQSQYIHSLFDYYGSVVRVGPNKVMFNDLASSRSVYSVHRFDKSIYYKSFDTNGNEHMFTSLDRVSHAMHRRGSAPHYTVANLIQYQPEMQQHTLELTSYLSAIAGKTSTDCLPVFRHLLLDVMSTTSYNYDLGALSEYSAEFEHPLAGAVNDFPKWGILKNALPLWAWNLAWQIPNARWRAFYNSDQIIAKFVNSRIQDVRSQNKDGKLDGCNKVPMLHRMLQYKHSENVPMPDADILSEAMAHIIAGTDTTSASLSYFVWELSRRPDIIDRLRKELDNVMPDPKSIPDMSVLNSLPYLDAFIKEGLRLYTAIPSPLWRVVPTTLGKSGPEMKSYNLMGYTLPPGTTVATQAWSMHRNASVFPSPDSFSPERWLEAEGEELKNMTAHMMPFGRGSRICIGQNVAQMMMRMVLASLVRNFDIRAAPETDERSMAMRDAFVMFPRALECKIFFYPRV